MAKDKAASHTATEPGAKKIPQIREAFDLQGQLLEANGQLLQAYEKISRDWLARLGSESELSSEFVANLRNARSIPEAIHLYTKCMSQLMQMAAEDRQHLLNDWQQVGQIITGSMMNGPAAFGPMAMRKHAKTVHASHSSH